MASTRPRGHRSASTAVLAVFGTALAGATWINGERAFALVLVVFYVIASGLAWVWAGGSGDVAAIMRVGGDERQKIIDLKATAYSGLAAGMFSLVAVIVETVRDGDPGPYAVVCAVAGFAYMISLAVLRRRV